jgi:predicted nucleotidyltransferase
VENSEAYKIISKTVKTLLPDSRVLLFGSRARGEYDRFSDFDILIITSFSFSPKEKIDWHSKLDWAITKAIAMPVDILINSEEEVSEKMLLHGHIIRSVVKEGIAI